MNGHQIISSRQKDEEEELLKQALGQERTSAGGLYRWRCSADLRLRVVSYARSCLAAGDSLRRVAERLGITQGTLSRWLRDSGEGSFQPVSIVPAGPVTGHRPASALRVITPRGFVVEGLDLEQVMIMMGTLE